MGRDSELVAIYHALRNQDDANRAALDRVRAKLEARGLAHIIDLPPEAGLEAVRENARARAQSEAWRDRDRFGQSRRKPIPA